MSTTEQPTTADDVKAIVEEHDIRFIRFWFTDILGQLKSFSINAAELDDAFEGGMGFDGSSITGFNAIEESDMIAMPDAVDLRGAARGARRSRASARDVLRHRSRPSARPTRATRATSCAARSSARARWASTPSTSAPSSSTSSSRTRTATEVLDEGGYFDLTTLDAGSDVRRETVLALEQLGIHVEYTHHEVGPSPARDRHALRRRAEDGRRLHDLPHHGQGVRHEVRLACDVHAQAALRRERLGDAHPHESLFKDGTQRVLRRRRPVLPVRRRQGVHRRPAQARARDLARSSPSG